jgi:hypothetical protein
LVGDGFAHVLSSDCSIEIEVNEDRKIFQVRRQERAVRQI